MTNLRNIEENLAINATLRKVEDEREQHEQPKKRMVAIGCATNGGAFVVLSGLEPKVTDDSATR